LAGTLKILAVSDRVLDRLYTSNVRERVPEIDVIVGCGDLPYYYLDFLISALDVPLVYVHGNHDGGPQYTVDRGVMTGVPGGKEIHGRSVKIKDVLFAGLGGSMRYRPRAPHMYTETEMRGQVARLVPRLIWNRQRHGRYLDVLVAHSPPFGIHDRTDLPHTGFKVFLTLMQMFKPRYLLHGHIHIYSQDYARVTQHEQTTVVNVFPYKVMDLEID
jgi:Icc-related predicted phosphoesterase